ncbi:MAG: hypothetical protein AB7N61_23415 [Acidimicrobiia bacterium]
MKTETNADRVRLLYPKGVTKKAIAEEVGVSEAKVKKIIDAEKAQPGQVLDATHKVHLES